MNETQKKREETEREREESETIKEYEEIVQRKRKRGRSQGSRNTKIRERKRLVVKEKKTTK